MNRSRLVLALVTVLCVAGCADTPTGGPTGGAIPHPGILTLRLTTPNADDGAMAFEVSGPAVDTVLTSDASLLVFSRRVNDSTLAGAVVGDLAEGAVVQFRVADLAAAARYTARVIEVADRQDEVRGSLTGYALTVVP